MYIHTHIGKNIDTFKTTKKQQSEIKNNSKAIEINKQIVISTQLIKDTECDTNRQTDRPTDGLSDR